LVLQRRFISVDQDVSEECSFQKPKRVSGAC